MAAPYEEDELELWRKSLNSHPIFEELRQQDKRDGQRTDPEELLAVRDGQLFAWDGGESRLLTMNLKDLLERGKTEADDVSVARNKLQRLLCTNMPRFHVEHIKLSISGQQVLLWGAQGASVLTLPRRHGQFAQFEGGKEQINCRTVTLAERFFMSSGTVRLLQAAWYPGSSSDTHLVLLTSDNTIRIYDTTSPHKPIQCHRLGEYSTSYSLSASRSTFEVALGDIAVAFDFGPATQEPGRGMPDSSVPILYPVYILKGNGDVFLLTTSLTDPKYMHTHVRGPLTMHPPAEDNYGLDACSLMCLHTSPLVLVVATSAGILHHCIVLSGSEEEDEENDDSGDIHSVTSASMSALGGMQTQCSPSLYVYESVELSLTVLSDGYPEDNTYPILLHKDPTSLYQYYCSHSAGVHCVMLTWLQKLQKYCSTDDEGTEEVCVTDVINQDQSCVVAHMICTKPSESCPPAPIQGLAVVVDHLLGQAILCRTFSNDCIVAPRISCGLPEPPPLMSEASSKVASSPLRLLHTEPFQNHILKILQRNVSNPIFKGSSRTSLSPQESFELILAATKVLREEYVIKQDMARDEIEKRVKILQLQKSQQKADLAEASQYKTEIQDRAEKIASRHSDALDKQEELVERVGAVLHSLHGQLPMLSEAEQTLQKEMDDMQLKVELLKNSLQQVKNKDEYRKRKMQEMDRKISSPALSQSQNKHLRKLLKEETEAIASLVKDVNSLTIAVGH